MKREIKNYFASVHRQLQNKAKETDRPFNELLQYYAAERFLYRFSQSKHKDKVILKGAMMFIVWKAPYARVTRDIDMLGRLHNSMENVMTMVKDVCKIEYPSDGIVFTAETVQVEQIMEENDYKGARVSFTGLLGNARIPMQIDLGFGDVIFPEPENIDYPTLLNMPSPTLKGYPRETVIAEKFHTMMNKGIINSRMKDYYDIWLLSSQFDFDGVTLQQAIEKTFKYRGAVPASPTKLFDEISLDKDKNIQWSAFIRKSGLDTAPKDIKDVIKFIKDFLLPIMEDIIAEKICGLTWKAAGPWKKIR